ncbi:MAG: sigma-70 family RNA polymerase sigma factor [Planctomycetes bacterium]|nr:sigma-70 family RNA polymerase sigma factor [Planctomycetota bacterium]
MAELSDKTADSPDTECRDETLLREYQQGKAEALKELFIKYQKPLFNFVYRLSDDYTLAEDILQDLFIRMAENIGRFSPKRSGSLRQWLYQVAINLYRDNYRHNQKVKEAEPNLAVKQIKAEQPNKTGITRSEFEELLAQLPQEQKEVVLLKVYSGLTFREISETINCPLNTALSRMQYALKSLRKVCLAKGVNR